MNYHAKLVGVALYSVDKNTHKSNIETFLAYTEHRAVIGILSIPVAGLSGKITGHLYPANPPIFCYV